MDARCSATVRRTACYGVFWPSPSERANCQCAGRWASCYWPSCIRWQYNLTGACEQGASGSAVRLPDADVTGGGGPTDYSGQTKVGWPNDDEGQGDPWA